MVDRNDAWQATAVILSKNHGLSLGEHEYWDKNRSPFFNEVVHIPLVIHHPDCQSHGVRPCGWMERAICIAPLCWASADWKP